MRRSFPFALIPAILLTTAPLSAQTQTTASTSEPQKTATSDDYHDVIVVTGRYVRNLDVLSGISVLGGERLAQEMRPQIGEVLTKLPGVSATSFAPGASRPVIRGFQGERVRVLTDGIGSIDVSNTSSDHAVTIDPMTAERIEVLRGPAVLLYGSQAIGGAVNILDKRIPRKLTDEKAHVDLLATYGTAARERSIGASIDMPLGDGFMWHLDGGYHKTDDLRSGGFVYSKAIRDKLLHLAEHDDEDGLPGEAAEKRAMATAKGRIPNSATETKSAGTGFAWFGEGGSFGGSIGYYDTYYGAPARPNLNHRHAHGAQPGHGHGHEGHDHGNVTIGMKQWRGDVRGEILTGDGFLGSIRARAGMANYTHTEYEGGKVGTVFDNKGAEGRVEFVQNERNGWSGTSGVQYMTRDLKAVGEEAFIPPNATNQIGLFTLQEWAFGPVGVEAALRYEHSRVRDKAHAIRRSFDAVSGALGLSYALDKDIKLGVNIARAARAPSAEELFSDGAHIATQAYEIGDPSLKVESNWGGELYARIDKPRFSLALTGYANRFQNYIYEQATGAVEHDLPVYRYIQRDASYWGVEAEGRVVLGQWGDTRLSADAIADYTRARVDLPGGGSANVPRIPPFRVLGGIEADADRFAARLEAEHSAPQRKVAALETTTAGFTLLNASATWRPMGKAGGIALMLSGNNLLDVEARRAASFTKDFVPLAGRDIRATVRLSF